MRGESYNVLRGVVFAIKWAVPNHGARISLMRSTKSAIVVGLVAALTTACVTTDEENAATDESKMDWVGNRSRGDSCTSDWQCRDDDGLVCRPVSRPQASNLDLRCELPGAVGEPCLDVSDCGGKDRACVKETTDQVGVCSFVGIAP